jgi:hypothetical protein
MLNKMINWNKGSTIFKGIEKLVLMLVEQCYFVFIEKKNFRFWQQGKFLKSFSALDEIFYFYGRFCTSAVFFSKSMY